MTTNRYAKDFFALQLRFAEKAAELTGRPLTECIQKYTAFPGTFGLGTSFDWEAPLWKRYISAIDTVPDPLEWTYQTYLTLQAELPPSTARIWGCFGYNLHFDDPTVIRPHFNNNDESGLGALSSARQPVRMAELRAMFARIQQEAPQARTVRGESWLYNHSGYVRLFPPEFGASAHALPPERAAFQFRAMWGQLLGSNGQVRAETATAFLRELAAVVNVDNLYRCFPYRILRAECAIDLFYRFYGLSEA